MRMQMLEKHIKSSARVFQLVAVLCAWMVAAACDHDGGGGGSSGSGFDFGDNDPSLYAAVGDSITEGRSVPAGPPYPERLAAKLGKPVLNYGVAGARAASGVGQANRALGRKPGYLLILFGSNDAIKGADPTAVGESIRAIIRAAFANKTLPIVATIPPQTDSHAVFDGLARGISTAIRTVAAEEGAPLVDLAGAFGSGEGLLQGDGLHPNSAGTELIASSFAGAL